MFVYFFSFLLLFILNSEIVSLSVQCVLRLGKSCQKVISEQI